MSDLQPFIKEQIVPNKKNKWKKLSYSAGTAAVCALVFGLVGSLVFTISRPYFEERFGTPDRDSVSFTAETPEPGVTSVPTPAPAPVTAAPAPEPPVVEFPELGKEQIAEFYGLLSEIAAEFNHSVVTVSGVVKGVDWFDNPSELEDATCGLIIAKTEKNLFLLSAYNRISDASSIRVTFSNKETYNAKLHDYDKETNLAVLSIALQELSEDLRKSAKSVILGDSYHATPGTPVLALGSPNGITHSMDFGMVSSKASDQYITDNKLEVFRTSMSAAENGEGVIVDLEGRVLGIITHHQDKETGFCTAIGITRLKGMIEKLVNNEPRASLGILANDIPESVKKSISVPNGIYISKVNNNSAALDAGLKTGDVITKFNDHDVSSVVLFNNLLTACQPKDSVTLSIIRTSKTDEREMEVEVILGKK